MFQKITFTCLPALGIQDVNVILTVLFVKIQIQSCVLCSAFIVSDSVYANFLEKNQVVVNSHKTDFAPMTSCMQRDITKCGVSDSYNHYHNQSALLTVQIVSNENLNFIFLTHVSMFELCLIGPVIAVDRALNSYFMIT